jgi:hypothetical protein
MTLRPARLWLAVGVFSVPALLAQVPPNNAPKPPSSPPVVALSKTNDTMVDSFKLADGDIDSVLSSLEMFTGRTVIRPGQLPTATYSLKISRPIPK